MFCNFTFVHRREALIVPNLQPVCRHPACNDESVFGNSKFQSDTKCDWSGCLLETQRSAFACGREESCTRFLQPVPFRPKSQILNKRRPGANTKLHGRNAKHSSPISASAQAVLASPAIRRLPSCFSGLRNRQSTQKPAIITRFTEFCNDR